MDSLVGLTSFASTYHNEQDSVINQDKYADEYKLFRNKSIDLCGIIPPAVDLQSEQQPFNLVYQIINSKSLFFETILEADDGLSNEFWLAVGQQADASTQHTSVSAESVLMRTVSFYVTRLLPIESTVPSIGCAPLVTEVGHRKRTPLDLFLPTSPLVNSINRCFRVSGVLLIDDVEVKTLNNGRLLMAHYLNVCRYLLKQFHVFCMYDMGDQESFAVKVCPWMPFIRVHEKFYRILLGKIFRRVATFNLTIDTVRVVRATVEFSWKEPMVTMLRLVSTKRIQLSNTAQRSTFIDGQKQSFLHVLFGESLSPSMQDNYEVIKSVEDLLAEADANMGTHFMAQATLNTDSTRSNFPTNNYYTPFSETPKRAPQLLPDHVRDPTTGLMYLTDLGKRQVWSGERWCWLFSVFSPMTFRITQMKRSYSSLGTFVSLSNVTFSFVALAEQYSKDTVFGAIARTVMDPPCPNPSGSVTSPVFSKTLKVSPPEQYFEYKRILYIRDLFQVLANYGVLLRIQSLTVLVYQVSFTRITCPAHLIFDSLAYRTAPLFFDRLRRSCFGFLPSLM
ncbi:unnamed protein product [Angiostrongylus costaricensis]|uniref:PH domain-containing protein n=1 Tax=Angiostrongylus costaricensis TaxID=334426 RepID=A0A158PM49_ANGCS|nr:unnamed protein product [Angiostrongylus costaricensis]